MFDFEYIYRQREGDQFCTVSLSITQNRPETRITCVPSAYNDNDNNTKNVVFSVCYGYDNNTSVITVCVHTEMTPVTTQIFLCHTIYNVSRKSNL